ncbi:MAG: GNAT family N-acetyltransferase [Oscillospiraceae bacterium]|nr:GNAT family N-acetyltransferase [Oscillospiraceae bacterium]
MIIRWANASDRASLMALWRRAFSEEEDFLQRFFRLRFHPENCLLLEEKGVIAAAVHTFPVHGVGFEEGIYLVGAATNPEFRRRGFMTLLLKELKSKVGDQPIFLFPAEDRRGFYEKRGFVSGEERLLFSLSRWNGKPQSTDSPKPTAGMIRMQYLQQLAALGGGLLRDEISWSFLLQESSAVTATARDYALVCGERAIETAAEDLFAAKALLGKLKQMGLKEVCIRKGGFLHQAILEQMTEKERISSFISLPGGMFFSKKPIAESILIDEIY